MVNSKRVWVWVGIIVVVVILAVIFFWRPATPNSQPAATSPAPVYASQGQLTPNFPKDLILDPQAQVESSYAINYNPGDNEYTAQWASSSSLATLYGDYTAYLSGNGWTISNSSNLTAASTMGAIYASNASANVNVSIVAQGTGSDVTISYVGG